MNSNDLIRSCKWCLAFTAVLLLYGLPFAATCVAAFGLILYPFQSKSFHRLFRDLRKWVLLSTFALAASLGSFLILKLALQKEVQEYSYFLWMLGTAIHELAGGFLAYFLYIDYIKEPCDCQTTVQFLEVRIKVLKGRNLVAKDTNIFGKPTTSDPYVKIYHKNHYVGETSIVWKTLDPEWTNEQFHLPVIKRTLSRCNHLELNIIDRDKFSSDDPMGAVMVPIPKDLNIKVRKWYKVGNGSGPFYCPNPSGDLQVEVELRQLLSKRFKRQISRKSNPRQFLSNRYLKMSRQSIQVDPAMPAKSTRRMMTPTILPEDDELSDSHTDSMSQGTDEIFPSNPGDSLSVSKRRKTLSSPLGSKNIRFSTPSPFGSKNKRFSTFKKMPRISLSPKRGKNRQSFLPGSKTRESLKQP